MLENKNKYLINGEIFECELKDPLLNDLIRKFLQNDEVDSLKIAVAVNNVIIEKNKWNKQKIKFEDKIEIVAPFFGG